MLSANSSSDPPGSSGVGAASAGLAFLEARGQPLYPLIRPGGGHNLPGTSR